MAVDFRTWNIGNLDALMDAGIDDIKSLDDFGSKSVRKKDGEIEEPVRALSIKAFFIIILFLFLDG